MYLKSLEVQGFKSFPDKTLIRFGDDITAIVGPNGSGKSNISDAILWVMGEQSSKTLRGARMEDVIFGGTQKRGSVGFAEATLTLDNTDRALPYDADEVMVTRRYYRSGEGEYYINRQTARLRDIHEMFMDTGLGREGYSNIGQGRIDEILSLKSGDRREIFEEAAGISKYRHRKEETQRKLLQTEDNLLRIGDKVSELELQLEPLKLQSEKAKKYLALKEELKGVEVALWLQQLQKLSADARKAQEDHASAQFVLQQAQDDLDALYRRAEELAGELRRRDGELETLRLKLTMLQANGQQLDGQQAVLRGSLENNSDNLARIRQELKGQEDRSGGIAGQIAAARDQVAQIGGELQEKTQALQALSLELAALTANAQGRSRRFLELRGRLSALAADIAGRQADCAAITQAREQTAQRLSQLGQDLASGDQRLADAQAELTQAGDELQAAQAEATAAQNTISGYTLRQKTRQQRADGLQEQYQQQSQRLQSISARAGVYRAMERDFESYHKAVRMVLQEAQAGRLSHVHGPVSRLIRAQEDCALAIEIALGAALQNIVVDSEADGKQIIAFLKRTGGGRVTILPISTIRGRRLQESGLAACRGFVGIAADLVQTQEQYLPIIENLLGRTVVVSDLDAAIAMAKKYGNAFKLVTLDGQVMNPGGSMTGGSTSKEAGILSRANELEKLTREEKRLQRDLALTEGELAEARRLAQEVQFQLTAASGQLRQAQDQVLRLQGRRDQARLLLEVLTQAREQALQEQQTLTQRASADAQRLAAHEAQLRLYADQQAREQAELEALELTETQAAQDMAHITGRDTQLRSRIAALQAQAQAADAHIADLTGLQTAMQGDRQQKLALAEQLRADSARLEAELRELSARQQENDAQVKKMQTQLSAQLQARAAAESAKTRAEREAQEKNKDILHFDRAVQQLENKRATTALEESQIVDKLWESYGLTPGTAAEHQGQLESVAAGSRRAGDLKRRISLLGTPNLGAIEEYARVNERYTYLASQRDDVLTSKRELENIIRDLTKEMTTIFVSEFGKINHYFGQVFEEMFGGGRGQLLLEDPEAPLTCGIEIRVQPPGKQVKTITLLSGGEKAFVATALYFAILKVRPTPFCLLDEIDAALDDRNVERFASYLRNLAKNTQFIVITHRRGTMEASDVLYGVTMQEQGVSKLLRLDLNQMEQYLGISE